MKKQALSLALALLLVLAAVTATAASAPSVFPIEYTAFDNSYSITGYSLDTEEDSGNTSVVLWGRGYNVLPLRNGQFCVPVWCNAVAGGKTYKCVSASVSGDQVEIFFDDVFTPEEIIILNGDTWEEMATFKVADEQAVPAPGTDEE